MTYLLAVAGKLGSYLLEVGGELLSYLLSLSGQVCSYLLEFHSKSSSYLFKLASEVRSYLFFFLVHPLLFLPPLLFSSMLPLLLTFELSLQRVDLVNQLILVSHMLRVVLLNSLRSNDDALLQFASFLLGLAETSPGIGTVGFGVFDNCNFGVKTLDSGQQSFNLDFFLRDVHLHYVLLLFQGSIQFEGG